MDTRLETAPVHLYDGERPIGTAVAHVIVAPGKAVVGYGVKEIRLHDGEPELPDGKHVGCMFDDPIDAIAFMAASDPHCFGKDQ